MRLVLARLDAPVLRRAILDASRLVRSAWVPRALARTAFVASRLVLGRLTSCVLVPLHE